MRKQAKVVVRPSHVAGNALAGPPKLALT
jgi:hypothetical protein